MTDKIKLVQGDTRPALICTLKDENTGEAIDLTDCTVVLKFRALGSETLQATVPGSVVNGPAGSVVFYPASAPEMLQGEPGDYEGEVEITFADGQKQTVFDPLKFKVREDF
jgi:hypothetical protein